MYVQGLRRVNLLESRPMFGVCIHEVSGARTHQHEHRDLQALDASANKTGGGRGAAMREIGAQLDALRAARLGGQRGVERLDGRFDKYRELPADSGSECYDDAGTE